MSTTSRTRTHSRPRRRALTVLVLAAAAALMAAAPAAAEVQDANCAASVNSAASGPGNLRYAQTFTAQNSGALTRATIEITRQAGSNGDYIVQIVEVNGSAVPQNSVLAAVTIADATVPTGNFTLNAVFPAPPEVVAGQQYAVLVTRPGSTDLRLRVHTPDACAGQMYASADQDDPFNLFLGGGYDMLFAVFVEPPVAPSDTTAPDTTITGGPKTKEKKGKATFSFTSSEAGLDLRVLARRRPVRALHLAQGRQGQEGQAHVRGARPDAAGNVDATPATQTGRSRRRSSSSVNPPSARPYPRPLWDTVRA